MGFSSVSLVIYGAFPEPLHLNVSFQKPGGKNRRSVGTSGTCFLSPFVARVFLPPLSISPCAFRLFLFSPLFHRSRKYTLFRSNARQVNEVVDAGTALKSPRVGVSNTAILVDDVEKCDAPFLPPPLLPVASFFYCR